MDENGKNGELNPETPGVLGDGALQPGKGNMALIRKAIRNRWPINREIRQKLVDQMLHVMEGSENERNQIAAARVLATVDAVNAKREDTAAPKLHAHMVLNIVEEVVVVPHENGSAAPGTNGFH